VPFREPPRGRTKSGPGKSDSGRATGARPGAAAPLDFDKLLGDRPEARRQAAEAGARTQPCEPVSIRYCDDQTHTHSTRSPFPLGHLLIMLQP
jgi:hypothetical protein